MSGAHNIKVEGHRGVFKYENTLLGFQKALEYKIDSIEIDVFLRMSLILDLDAH